MLILHMKWPEEFLTECPESCPKEYPKKCPMSAPRRVSGIVRASEYVL